MSVNGIREWKCLKLALVGCDLQCGAASAGMCSQVPAPCSALSSDMHGYWDVVQQYVVVGCPVVLLGAQLRLTRQC